MASLRLYMVTRALLTIPVVLILLTTVFIVLRVMPGDPVEAVVGPKAPEEYKERVKAELGFDKPIHVQYVEYLSGIFRGDFGNSMIWGRKPVLIEISEAFPATVELTISGFLVSAILGVLTGVLAARRPNTKLDAGLRLYGIVTYTLFIPWLGNMLQILLGVQARLFPIASRIGVEMAPETVTGLYVLDSILTLNLPSLTDTLYHLALPSLTLGMVLSGVYTRLTRSNMIEVLGQDFIRAARARGLRERTVLWHCLKNAFIPIVTMMGLQFAILLAGAILTETAFSWPGMGRLTLQRIELRDYTTIQGIVVIFAVLVALVSLAVDLIYAYIDPRIRY